MTDGRHYVSIHLFCIIGCLSMILGIGSVACTCEQHYVIREGKTTKVTSDLTIQDIKKVIVTGNLVSSGDNGQNVTIKTNGDIIISGKVIAGNGGEGQDGGTLTIISENGDIDIGDTAFLKAGDGHNGTSSLGEEGAGKRGGSVIFKAPNGTITFPDAEGTIYIGNGGNGADINIHGEDLLTTELPEQLSNAGGDSGEFLVEASQIIGLTYEVITLTEDIVDPETGEIIVLAGRTFHNVESDKQLITGGVGGDAGSLYYGIDEEGNSTYPVVLTTNSHSRLVNWEFTKCVFATEQEAGDEVFKRIKVKGAPGGNGEEKGGKGGNVHIRGRNGGTLSNGNGQAGQYVSAWGGHGGNCDKAIDCAPNSGGSAFAVGGNGGHGADPCGNGGKGGFAEAMGGQAGESFFFPGPARLGFMGMRQLFRDAGGNASAHGGYGGDGGGTCPDNVCDKGGDGGTGGLAFAMGGPGKPDGDTYATGGDGGDGGDGNIEAGVGEWGGSAAATSQGFKFERDGEHGDPGETCLPAANRMISAYFVPYCTTTETGAVIELDFLAIDLTGGEAPITKVIIKIDGVEAYNSGPISATEFPQGGKRFRGKVSPGTHYVTSITTNVYGQQVEYTEQITCSGSGLITDQSPTPGLDTPSPGPVCPTCGKPVDQCTCPE